MRTWLVTPARLLTAAIAAANPTGYILVADPGADAVLRRDPNTGAQSVLVGDESFGNPIDIAMRPVETCS